MPGVTEPSGRALGVRGLRPGAALAGGCAGVVVVTVAVAPFGDSIGHATQALLLVLPVVATAVAGGRRPAQVVAALATLMFTLVLPPVGTLRVRFTEDVVALVVFFAVALSIGGLVAYRIETFGRLERQRAALLRSVSHDLRTPLAAIRVAVSELEDSALYDAAGRARLLRHVDDEAARLDRLVANLLSLARIEGGGLRPRRQAVDLVEVAQRAAAHLRPLLDDVTVEVTAEPDVPPVLADHTLLEQVVANLLENAARYGPPGGPIEVRVAAVPGAVRLAVRDHGPGVPTGDRDVIFRPFHAGRPGTTGVGLAICQAVVAAHGGTIAVDDPPGGGAEFVVTVPRA